MREVVFKKQFKKDYQRIQRTGRDTGRLFEAISLLQAGETIPPHFRDHQLTGNLKDCRECHLGGDWLLLYQYTDEVLVLIRSLTASDGITLNAPCVDDEAVVLGLGVLYDINETTRVSLNYRGDFRLDSQDAHTFGIGASFGF